MQIQVVADPNLDKSLCLDVFGRYRSYRESRSILNIYGMLSGTMHGATTGVGISMGGLEVLAGTREDAETVLPWRCIRFTDDEENDHGTYYNKYM